ncbi:Exodeoxyribonuclease VII large subunit [Succinivibrio dextrinosolvens DSM 3072]|uniref:Exodeoxyribonuclease 7 large subunit n=1 Tax=Succinivibrio dextrinosolvens DSM 3072 TaxID=1123324 RepID=A0A1T4V9H7_9GAMM|nr:exodeoxyribonuclease VII large subunit [Succinivibrio dextrinosolvens]SKA61171.1 Exodeoxyribonuclease VII large subunit [Succinivibrio dextrinosolvens DSM 3072]
MPQLFDESLLDSADQSSSVQNISMIDSLEERPSEGSWSVSEFLHQTDSFFKTLGPFVIYGEISEIKSYNHIYFKLKDSNDGSTLDCVMWQSYRQRMSFEPKAGDKVELNGSISLFTKNGQFKFIAHSMRKLGLGSIMERLNELKRKLESEGYFSREKRCIPRFVNTVGVVTSADGRAIGDIIKTIEHRNPLINIILYPSLVQGASAPQSLLSALNLAIEHNQCDVIIIGRGGGSFEDLLAFFDEELVKAVAKCPIPIISAVGHEADYAFTDFAADMRAATPTRAAEFVSSVLRSDLYNSVEQYVKKMSDAIFRIYDYECMNFDHLCSRLKNSSPQLYVDNISKQVDLLINRLDSASANTVSEYEHRLNSLKERLSVFEPSYYLEQESSKVKNCLIRMNSALDRQLFDVSERLNYEHRVLSFNSLIDKKINLLKDRLKALVNDIQSSDVEDRLNRLNQEYIKQVTRLSSLNPLYILNRGYSITFDNNDHAVDIDSLKKGDIITTMLSDGRVKSEIVEIQKNDKASIK